MSKESKDKSENFLPEGALEQLKKEGTLLSGPRSGINPIRTTKYLKEQLEKRKEN